MAGNTKFVGFMGDSRIQLERWGVRADVSLDPHSMENMRQACFNSLPKKPPQQTGGNLPNFRSAYDSDLGRVKVDLSVETATYLADLLEVLVKNDIQAMEKTKPWIEGLRAGAQAHADFHNTSEPGVQ